MRKRLSKREIQALSSISERLVTMRDRIEENDVELQYGNGTASEQVSCAIAAIDCILQEYY